MAVSGLGRAGEGRGERADPVLSLQGLDQLLAVHHGGVEALQVANDLPHGVLLALLEGPQVLEGCAEYLAVLGGALRQTKRKDK